MNARREKLQPQSSLSDIFPTGSVIILHPGCDAALFSFPAFPHPDPANKVYYGTPSCLVLDACRALTNYAAKDDQDFFARGHAGEDPVPIQVDRVDILGAGCYYYFLGPPATAANAKYPIVKEFAALTFPHDFPRHWSRTAAGASSTTSPLVMARERLPDRPNDSPYAVDVAALVPPTEVDWFNANEMYRYLSDVETGGVNFNDPGSWPMAPRADIEAGMKNPANWMAPATDVAAAIENAANWITLRTDIREILYKHGLVFYPSGDGARVAYFLDTAYLDYAAEYHRQRVELHAEVADQFIYARFAHAVINLPRCEDLFDAVPVRDVVRWAKEVRLLKVAMTAPPPPGVDLGTFVFQRIPYLAQLFDYMLRIEETRSASTTRARKT